MIDSQSIGTRKSLLALVKGIKHRNKTFLNFNCAEMYVKYSDGSRERHRTDIKVVQHYAPLKIKIKHYCYS